MSKKLSVLTFLVIAFLSAAGQSYKITGKIIDSADNSALIGVNLVLYSARDSSTLVSANVSDADGNFDLTVSAAGLYKLKATYIGYVTVEKRVFVKDGPVNIGTIVMRNSSTKIGEVEIEANQVRSQQIGDTVQFNADAFKTNPDASAEDLVKKMPGVTSDNGTVKVNGEDVKQVLVDGKPFFGDDPNVALKNLPAEVIDKIQVFDKMSDQSQLTGFNDGNNQKTINIITKPGKNNGQFGKIYGGYGTDDRYLAGGNVNIFKGNRRISLIGLSNNINQQNFNSQDLLGVVGSTGGGGRGNFAGGGGNRGGASRGGPPMGGGAANNFLVGQSNGISTTNSFGINYSDSLSRRLKISGSYFLNASGNDNSSALSRTYVNNRDSGLRYTEVNTTNTDNMNHRINMRLEFAIDSNSTFIWVPNVSFQNTKLGTMLEGRSFYSEQTTQSHLLNTNTSKNNGYNFSNNMVYRRKLNKVGRTLSINLNTSINNKEGNGTLRSLNEYNTLSDSVLVDQHSTNQSNGVTISPNITYTEPLGKKGQLMLTYSPTFTKSRSEKETRNLNTSSNEYSLLDTQLTNRFANTYNAQSAGVGYNHNGKKAEINVSANVQYANLKGKQEFPVAPGVDKTFFNVLPQANYNYKFSQSSNIRMRYRASTNVPSVNQLQNLVNNTNPLLLSSGNPDLKQEYSHFFMTRYGKTNTEKARSFFVFAMATLTQNYIGNSVLIPTNDTVVQNGLVLKSGSQLTRPVNLEGYYNANTFMTYSVPFKKIKSNLSFMTGLSFNRTPALINDRTNFTRNFNISQSIVVGSNISEKIDFSVTYTGNYSIVSNTLQTQSNYNYFYQVTSARLNLLFLKRGVFNTSVNHTLYTGLAGGFNQNYILWNMSLGYKALKDKSLEIKATVFDLLNQNNSISRNVTEVYIEDTQTNVLKRYVMLVLTYNLKNFGAAPKK